jgi:integral membrane sensor domain MASE1
LPAAQDNWSGYYLLQILFIGVGYRIWPAILAGAFVANAITAVSIFTSPVIVVGNTLESLVAAYLINRWSYELAHSRCSAWFG